MYEVVTSRLLERKERAYAQKKSTVPHHRFISISSISHRDSSRVGMFWVMTDARLLLAPFLLTE